jgi:hypothetical protein
MRDLLWELTFENITSVIDGSQLAADKMSDAGHKTIEIPTIILHLDHDISNQPQIQKKRGA